MRRALILGCGGSGKSTFALKLAKITKLPIHHLDSYYWRDNWTEPAKQEWQDIIKRLTQEEVWILDGNYGATVDERLRFADTVYFFDFPRKLCLYRIFKRIWMHRGGKTRPDLAANCPERFDWDFIKWIWNYNRDRRPDILKKLEEVSDHKKVIIFKSDNCIKNYLNELKNSKMHKNLDN